jgi:hypothetical protein
VFALLREPELSTNEADAWPRRVASAMVVVFAFLALGEMFRVGLEERRQQPAGVPPWRDAQVFGAADALAQDGVQPGDEIACMGVTACLHDYYWARLAGVRITTEIFAPDPSHLWAQWQSLPNRQQALDTLRAQGAKVLVAHFNAGEQPAPNAADGWRQMGETAYWAYPLTLQFPAAIAPPAKAWVAHGAGNQ